MLNIAGCFLSLLQDIFGTYLLMLEEKSGGEEAKDHTSWWLVSH